MAVSQDAIGRRFELLRKRNEQDVQGRTQQEDEAIKRNFARTGGIGSGAQIKVQQQAAEQRAKDVASAKEGLDVAESGERFQQDQIQAQRDFAKGEREASQLFAQGERGASQRFARREREGSQRFASMEAGKQRGFSKKLFDKEMKFKDKQFAESIKQFAQQFKLDEKVANFNMEMAEKVFNKKGLLEQLFSSFGTNQMLGSLGDVGTGVFGSVNNPFEGY